MIVLLLLVAATILYTLFDLFAAKAGGKLNENLAATIFNGLGAAIPLIIYLASKSKNATETTTSGIVYSLLAGVSIAIFSIILINLFARAENVSFILPTIYGGTVVLGSMAGIFVFKETISPLGMAGVALTIIGLGLLIYTRATSVA
jgi:transporter family protein